MEWSKLPSPPIHLWDQLQQKSSSSTGRSRESGVAIYCCETIPSPVEKTWEPHNILGKWIRLVAPNEDTQTQRWVSRSSVEITDRSFPIGSWVTKNGNVGQVQNLEVRADMRIVGTKLVALEVPFDRLRPVEKFLEGSFILYDRSWVGQVTRVIQNVTVKIGNDGETDPYTGVIDSRECPELFVCPYSRKFKIFPKQRISGDWHSLRESTWELIPKTKKQKIEREFVGRVHSVEVTSIDVVWLTCLEKDCQASPKPSNRPDKNLRAEDFSRVQLTDLPDVNDFRLGDIRLFDPQMHDTYETYETWKNSCAPKVRIDKMKELVRPLLGKYVSAECLRAKTVVDVLWKDSTRSAHLGVELDPYEATNVDFIRGDLVIPCSQEENSIVSFGVVNSAIHNLKKVNVTWLTSDLTVFAHATTDPQDLIIMNGYRCFPGNLVLRYKLPPEDPFLIGNIIEIRNDGSTLVKCLTTGDIRKFNTVLLSPIMLDDRHNKEPAPPALKLEQLNLLDKPVTIIAGAGLEDSNNSSVTMTSMPWDEHYFKHEPICVEKGKGKTLLKEILKLKRELTNGAHAIFYEGRLELFSVILIGSKDTPFEDFVFLFDMFVPSTFPNHPPKVFYKSATTIPFLRVLKHRDTSFFIHEALDQPWNPEDQNCSLANLLNSLQQSIFTKEPYYNVGIPGRACLRGSAQGYTHSRALNEKLIMDLVESTVVLLTNLFNSNLRVWREELSSVLSFRAPRIVNRINNVFLQNKQVLYPLNVLSPKFMATMTSKLPILKVKIAELSRKTQTKNNTESHEVEFSDLADN